MTGHHWGLKSYSGQTEEEQYNCKPIWKVGIESLSNCLWGVRQCVLFLQFNPHNGPQCWILVSACGCEKGSKKIMDRKE